MLPTPPAPDPREPEANSEEATELDAGADDDGIAEDEVADDEAGDDEETDRDIAAGDENADDEESDDESDEKEEEPASDRLVTVATYRFPNEAEMAKMHLEDAGIPAFIADVETVTMDWLLGNAIGNVKLQVAQSQAELAEAMLKKPERAEDDETEEETHVCLSCGAEMPEPATTCSQCGWSYEHTD